MADASAKVAGFAVMAMLTMASQAKADSPGMPTLVVHVHDYQNVDAVQMSKAKAEVSAVYASAGVYIDWTNGAAAMARPDGRKHVDLVILTRQMADLTEPDMTVLGRGSRVTKRAVIYHARLVTRSLMTGSRPESVLAYVIAHELGHVFLPEYSHAPSGLMRANWQGERMLEVPNFMAAQEREIRRVAVNPR